MAVDTPGGAPGSNLNMQKWQDTIEAAVYDKQRFLPRTTPKERGFYTLNIRKMGLFSGVTAGGTEDGVTAPAVFQSGNPSNVTFVPSWLMVPTAFPDSVLWVAGENVSPAYADGVEMALAAYIDNQYLQDVASVTANIGNAGYDIDKAGWDAASAQLATNAKVLAMLEDGAQVEGILGTQQKDDLMNVEQFTHANVRGDGQNPSVSGVIGKGDGVRVQFSTLLYSDANGLHGCMWVPTAFSYFYNQKPQVEKQRYLKQNRIVADCHFAHNILHNARAIDLRTKTT
jgi:hypothetical protein